MRIVKFGVYSIFPYAPGVNASTVYSNEIIRWMFDQNNKWSISRYWSEVSGGELQIVPTVFDMIFLEGQEYVDRLRRPKRYQTVGEAASLILQLGYDPTVYDGLVFIIPARSTQARHPSKLEVAGILPYYLTMPADTPSWRTSAAMYLA